MARDGNNDLFLAGSHPAILKLRTDTLVLEGQQRDAGARHVSNRKLPRMEIGLLSTAASSHPSLIPAPCHDGPGACRQAPEALGLIGDGQRS